VRFAAALGLLAFAGGAVPAAAAGDLTIALSTPEVRIDSNFVGTAVTVFGVIGRPAAEAPASGYQVVVLVEGPREKVVARRKDRFLGVWANAASETFAAPSYYALSSSVPVDRVADPVRRQELEIGFDALPVADGARAAPAQFRHAFLRLKEESGLYSSDGKVEFIGDQIFRTAAWIPANVSVGRYVVTAHLFADGALLASAADSVTVSKIGFERFVFAFSRNQSLVFGLATVAIALFSGWLAGVVFRRD
jgi:uncharacterized protein (TIGR02186 family)